MDLFVQQLGLLPGLVIQAGDGAEAPDLVCAHSDIIHGRDGGSKTQIWGGNVSVNNPTSDNRSRVFTADLDRGCESEASRRIISPSRRGIS